MQELRVFLELSRLSRCIRAPRRTVVAGIHPRLAQASSGRQVADINDDGPELAVGQDAPGGGHAGRRNSVLEDPVQLPIRVGLNHRGIQLRHGRRHAIGKRHPGVLTIQPMTSRAVMGKRFSSVLDVRFAVRQGVLHLFAADCHGVFDPVDGSGLPFSRRSGFACRKENCDAKNQD